jgi:lipopolysaccharide biosynthesis protein
MKPAPVERIVTLVTPDEHMRFKLACTRAKTTMAQKLRELALAWLRKQEEDKHEVG